jgi:endonuclease/exonuclease/phosphatase family metal-dependent hydrolase
MSTPDEDEEGWQLRSVLVLVVVTAVIATLAFLDHRRSAVDADGTPGSGPVSPSSSTSPPATRPRGKPHRASPAPPAVPRETRTRKRCVTLGGATSLVVTTFNIHSGLAGGGLHLDDLAAAIDSWDSDVVMLQEVSRGRGRVRFADEPTSFRTSLGMRASYGINVHPPDGGDYGVLTLSRYPIVSSTNTPLPTAPGAQQRGLLRTVIDVDGTRVAIYNTHLQDGYFHLRLQQMRAIDGVVAGEKLPFVLGGDLNSVPGSPVLAMTRALMGDSFGEVGVGAGATIPAPRPRIRIDYLLHSAALVPVQSVVMPLTASDHRGVRSAFTIGGVESRVCVPVLPSGVHH